MRTQTDELTQSENAHASPHGVDSTLPTATSEPGLKVGAKSDAFIPSREEHHRQLQVATAIGAAIRNDQPEQIRAGLRDLVVNNIDLAIAGVSSGMGSTASRETKEQTVRLLVSALREAKMDDSDIKGVLGRVAEGAVHRYFDYPITESHRREAMEIVAICYGESLPKDIADQVNEFLDTEAKARLGILKDSRSRLDAQQREAQIRELARQYPSCKAEEKESIAKVQNKKELTPEQNAAIKNATADLVDLAGRKSDLEVRDVVVGRLKKEQIIERNQIVHGISEVEKAVTHNAIVAVTDFKPDASTEQGRMEIHNRYLKTVKVAQAMRLNKDPETRRLIDERDRPGAIAMCQFATSELNRTMEARQQVRDILAAGMAEKKYGTEEGCREVFAALEATGLSREKIGDEMRGFITGRLERVAGNNNPAFLASTLEISDRLMRISNLQRDRKLCDRIMVLQTKLDALGGPPGIDDGFNIGAPSKKS